MPLDHECDQRFSRPAHILVGPFRHGATACTNCGLLFQNESGRVWDWFFNTFIGPFWNGATVIHEDGCEAA